MSEHISTELRSLVVERAGNRCEYCGLSQLGQEATFHVDHVQPLCDGGPTVETNLALACVSCSLRKGAKQKAVDPETGQKTPMFNPRRQEWSEHFQWNEEYVVPLTAIGRATADNLTLNRPLIVAIRREEAVLGRHPPDNSDPSRV